MCLGGHHDIYEQEIPYAAISTVFGFEGAPVDGSFGKYLGVPDSDDGPWFYLIRHEPFARIPRHTHNGNVMHYLLEGFWRVGDDESELRFPGFFHFERTGEFWGPLRIGPEGSKMIAIYDRRPDFIPADGNEPGYADPLRARAS
jgi:hypothetical protein